LEENVVKFSMYAAIVLFALGCAGAGGTPAGDDDADGGTGPVADGASVDVSIVTPGDEPDASVSSLPDAGPGDPDAEPACSPCELVPQCGCADGEACDLGGANPAQGSTECRPVLVPGTTTSTCTDSTSCAAGHVCLGVTAEASCKRYCTGDEHCDGGGGVCVIEVTSGGTPIPGVKVCSPDCDPFTSSGCPSGWACGAYSDVQEQRNFTWCRVPGQGGNNSICSDDGQCAAGFVCLNVASTRRCKKYCDRGDSNPGCSLFQQCVAVIDASGDPLEVAGVQYGVCN